MRPLGKTGDQWTSIGLGTWNMEKNPQDAIQSLQRGIDLGLNHVDTAEMYGDGKVEEIVGQALKGIRTKAFVVSKVYPQNGSYDGVKKACERSLKRLKMDYLDVYLLHWREKDTPLEQTFRGFEDLKKEGKIRHWGVSNFDVDDMKEAVSLVGEGKIACNQVLYNLRQRSIEHDLIPWCHEHDVTVVGYSPLGQGKLPQHKILDTLATKHGVTPAQIMLAFLTRDPKLIAIPKSAHVKRTEQNAAALHIQLSEDDINAIDKAFPAKARRSLPMV